jgi:hypothetical protein
MPRLIDNQIWNARSFSNLSVEDKLLFLYLETSPETNYYGVFILPNDSIISARTGLSVQKVKNSLEELEKLGKIAMVDDHLIIFNYFDRQKNNESEKTKKGLENFEKSLPINVFDTWSKGVSRGYQGGIIGPLSHLEENKVNKSKLNKIENKENIKEILDFYNSHFSKNLKSSISWEDNASYWLDIYSLAEIKEAITRIDNPNWWVNKNNNTLPTLEFVFRIKNKNGKVDYISELLNLKINSKPIYEADIEL